MDNQDADNFQRRSSQMGKAFATTCELTLQSIGFALLGKKRIENAGIEIDQVVRNAEGHHLYFEFKGSYTPGRPGLERTDTLKKALCNAFLMEKLSIGPYVLMTSHKPVPGLSSDLMLRVAGNVVFDVISLHDVEDMKRLQSYVHSLPWRSKIVGKRQISKEPPEDTLYQPSLLDIQSLQPFHQTKPKAPRKKKVGT